MLRSCCAAALLLALAACAWLPGGQSARQPVDDPEVLAFATRVDGFYRALVGVPLDVEMTYDDPRLRAYFESQRAFVDYYASLAAQLRDAQFRNTRAERVEIREFSFESPEKARVQVVLVGRHLRVLRFWEIEASRTDTWQLVDGRWLLKPERL